MANTEVYLTNSEKVRLDSVTTDSKGAFEFDNIPNATYDIVCGKTKMKWAGSNSSDALAINRYFVGLIKSFGDALMKKAADVDNNGKINSSDALMILRRFVGLIKKFNVPDFLYETPVITVNNNKISQTIHAICAGDVNASYPK